MTKWLVKTAFFVLPFLGLYAINTFCSNEKEGDLARLGYLYVNASPKREILRKYTLPMHYLQLSEWMAKAPSKRLDVLTIGDSFAEQGNIGFNNFLAASGLRLANVDYDIVYGDPVQRFMSLYNGGVLDSLRPRFVLLESVERYFVHRFETLNQTDTFTFEKLKKDFEYYRQRALEAEPAPKTTWKPLFSQTLLQIPHINLSYFFEDKPEEVDIYRITTTRNDLFGGGATDVLLYRDDIDRLPEKNDSAKLAQMNTWLNQMAEALAEKDIQLIVLICPDKYDLYYPYFKPQYPKSNFFAHYKTLPKKYHAPAIFEGLSALLPETKNVYFYDDSHWSPIGAKYTAEVLEKIVRGAE